jgi:hypothetical protein
MASPHQVRRGPALAGTPNPSQIGEPVTFSATLTAIDPISDLPTSAIPTGTVVFAVDQPEDPARQHEATLDASGVATWTTSDLTLGDHEIYATYLGDANFAPTWVMIDAPLLAATTFTALGEVLQPNATQWVKVKQTVVFPFRGFFQPVDNLALNVAKAGSGIPVKFSLGGDKGSTSSRTAIRRSSRPRATRGSRATRSRPTPPAAAA